MCFFLSFLFRAVRDVAKAGMAQTIFVLKSFVEVKDIMINSAHSKAKPVGNSDFLLVQGTTADKHHVASRDARQEQLKTLCAALSQKKGSSPVLKKQSHQMPVNSMWPLSLTSLM